MEKTAQFTEEEITVITDLYSKFKDIFIGTFHGPSGSSLKSRKWNEMLESVNAVGGNNRTLSQVKAKVKNLKFIAKKNATQNNKSFRKTGGGSDDDEEPAAWESKMLSTISNRQIYGISGGLDVHDKKLQSKREYISNVPKIGAGLAVQGSGQFKEELSEQRYSVDSSEVVLFDPLEIKVNEKLEISLSEQTSVTAPERVVSTEPFPNVTQENFTTPTQRDLTKKRKSLFQDGPQTKLMREQVSAVAEQVDVFKSIEKVLGDMRDISRERLQLEKVRVSLKVLQYLKKNNLPKDEDDLD